MKVGDYVRTKYGIAKYISDKVTRATIYKVIDKDIVYDNVEGWEDVLLDNEIIKSSPNITDLIEVGDVIRFIYDGVEYICNVEEELTVNLEDDMIYIKETNDKFKLISIITHEQFSQMEYRVGD